MSARKFAVNLVVGWGRITFVLLDQPRSSWFARCSVRHEVAHRRGLFQYQTHRVGLSVRRIAVLPKEPLDDSTHGGSCVPQDRR